MRLNATTFQTTLRLKVDGNHLHMYRGIVYIFVGLLYIYLSQRTVNEWNRLSADCVGASSVNIFKNKIDIYLRRAGYTLIDRLDSR